MSKVKPFQISLIEKRVTKGKEVLTVPETVKKEVKHDAAEHMLLLRLQ